MPQIISYRKVYDQHSTYRLATPEGAECTELCEIKGVTYVSVPDGTELPAQPAQIADSVAVVTLDPVLRDAIKTASPHCQLIDERMRDMIRAAYSMEDELKFARIGVGAAMGMYQPTSDEVQAMTVFGEFVEATRAWGRSQRTQLGL
jgi:hypothetical protein